MSRCICKPRSPDDQCPTHGYETWLRTKDSPVQAVEADCEKCAGTGARMICGEPYYKESCTVCEGEGKVPARWLSQCCSSPPLGEGVGDDNPTGTCGKCHDNAVFEKVPA